MALLTTQFSSAGAQLDSTTLQAVGASGDTFNRYASQIAVNNGDASSHTVTVTIGQLPSFIVTVPAGKVTIIGVSVGRRAGSPDPGGTLAYDATPSTLLIGAFASGAA